MTETLIDRPVRNVSETTGENDTETQRVEASKYIKSGRDYARNEKYAEALKDLQHATHLHPYSAEAFYYTGLVQLKEGKYKNAAEALKLAIQNSNANEQNTINQYYYKYAFACQQDGQFQEAVAYYTKFIENMTEEKKYPGLLNRGICYDKLEQYEQALFDFDSALTLVNEQGKPYCLSCRARVRAKMNDKKRALGDYDEAVSQTAAYIEQINESKKIHQINIYHGPSPIRISDYSPVGLLRTALYQDDAGNAVTAFQAINKVLDEPEALHRQIEELKKQKRNTTDDDKLRSITYNLNIAYMALSTVDKHKKAMEAFSENENLQIYYCTIYFKLEEIFAACKTAASGLVDPSAGKIGSAAEKITLLGEMFSIAPVVGEPMSHVIQPIVRILEGIDYQRQKNTMTRIARLGTTLELWEITQSVAETLTTIYRPLILQLLPPPDSQETTQIVEIAKGNKCFRAPKCFKKRQQQLTKADSYITESAYVAEYAAGLILEALLNLERAATEKSQTTQEQIDEESPIDDEKQKKDKKSNEDSSRTVEQKLFENETTKRKTKFTFDPTKKLDKQLVDIVCTPLANDGWLSKVKDKFLKFIIKITKPDEAWTLEGFYHESGILTADKQEYVPRRSGPISYPCRNGTKEEAERLNFQLKK